MTRVLGALLVAVLLTGCGTHTPTAAEKQRAKETAAFQDCKAVWGPVVTSMDDLDAHIAKGLGIDEYAQRAGASRTAYGKAVDQAKAKGGLSDECTSQVADSLTIAFNAYTEAYEPWNDCYTTPSCGTPRGARLAKIRRIWAKAADAVTSARTSLKALRPT